MTFTKANCTGIYKPLSNGVCVYNDTSFMNPLSGVSLFSAPRALSNEQKASQRPLYISILFADQVFETHKTMH